MFTTELLKSVDKETYEKIARLRGVTVNLVVFDRSMSLDKQIDANDFVLIDEADQIILDYA